ncbi:unnamed protein product, partial [Mesorhabditis belari]|uniref:Uncharacterized protein n=1 Tax=Mesorhabditis belari TaxID=2138241 RepID=A0AAF3ETU8_9BILA
MRFLLVIFVSLFAETFAETFAESDLCNECATPLLKKKWYTTGLPNYPSTLDFTDNCLIAGIYTRSTSCTTCFELSFPLDGSQQMVRGCWRNFVQGYDDLIEAGERCEYSISTTDNNTQISLGSSGKSTSNPVTVMRTCKPKDEPCNGKFAVYNQGGDVGPLGGAKEQVTTQCALGGVPIVEAGMGRECYSCSKYGQDGTCHRKSKSTCRSGGYCLKMDGKLGKNQVVMRSCAPINPFADSSGQSRDVCFHVDGKFEIGSMFGIGTDYTFDKKSYICICKTDRCNPARAQSVLLAGILSLLVTIRFFL